jgi:D-alanyl-D-alanine carboxypeptidase
MSETQELGGSARVTNQAVGYDAHGQGKRLKAELQNGPAMYAAAGMVSTARDMGTYMAALLSGRLLSPATYGLMWSATPRPQYGAGSSPDALFGLGWDAAIDTSAGPTEVNKAGNVPGFTSELVLYPTSDAGVFVSFNTNVHGGGNASGNLSLQIAQSVYDASRTGG